MVGALEAGSEEMCVCVCVEGGYGDLRELGRGGAAWRQTQFGEGMTQFTKRKKEREEEREEGGGHSGQTEPSTGLLVRTFMRTGVGENNSGRVKMISDTAVLFLLVAYLVLCLVNPPLSVSVLITELPLPGYFESFQWLEVVDGAETLYIAGHGQLQLVTVHLQR